jgi:hypothetical protein
MYVGSQSRMMGAPTISRKRPNKAMRMLIALGEGRGGVEGKEGRKRLHDLCKDFVRKRAGTTTNSKSKKGQKKRHGIDVSLFCSFVLFAFKSIPCKHHHALSRSLSLFCTRQSCFVRSFVRSFVSLFTFSQIVHLDGEGGGRRLVPISPPLFSF